MRLYLVQHGAAKSEAEDPLRGLTEEGRRTVERTAEFLASAGVSIDRIEHSEKFRARQTAVILAARLRPPEGTKQVAGMAPNDDIGPTASRVEIESKNLMLVGHLPHLSRLVTRLLELEADRTIMQFEMGGVVRIDRIESGGWVVRWALVPELLRPDSSR
jgi:phosphohistidine phosphatase